MTYQCKILIVPEEGWFGQPKYSTRTPTKNSFYVVSTSASIFFIKNYCWSDPYTSLPYNNVKNIWWIPITRAITARVSFIILCRILGPFTAIP